MWVSFSETIINVIAFPLIRTMRPQFISLACWHWNEQFLACIRERWNANKRKTLSASDEWTFVSSETTHPLMVQINCDATVISQLPASAYKVTLECIWKRHFLLVAISFSEVHGFVHFDADSGAIFYCESASSMCHLAVESFCMTKSRWVFAW